jgi:hypothetical protein
MPESVSLGPVAVWITQEYCRTFYDLDDLLLEMSNQDGFFVVDKNWRALQAAGIYERVLVEAFVGTPTNERPLRLISALIARASRGEAARGREVTTSLWPVPSLPRRSGQGSTPSRPRLLLDRLAGGRSGLRHSPLWP